MSDRSATGMRQEAPLPADLFDLVDKLAYKPGWRFVLSDMDRGQGSAGLTLDVITCTTNSYHPAVCEVCHSAVTGYNVHHYMVVPAAAYDRRSWQRWLFEQVALVERHEAAEFFRFEYDTPNQIGIENLGTNHHVERPYAPSHGPGNDPYLLREVGTDLDQRTSFRGTVNAP